VLAHGGPTGAADRGLKLKIQYWTSRGFAVLDVDYSGSTGYGRAYRRRLEGRWGVRDVADLVAAGDYLVREGLADAGKLAISGGSAGGYSVLMTLAHSQRFAAGSCYYGISDLALLLAHTHKFESGYLHRLLGTTPDDWQATFAARSPIVLADRISAPLIVFQGKDDKVVPPEQSQLIVERLMRNHVLVEYWEFDAEGHGFRRAGTIATALERELAFFTRVMRLKAYE
jgi:dipeptidyl aminopeptidase/acylaminoacyl peptidase